MFASNLKYFLVVVLVAFVAHRINGCFRKDSSSDDDSMKYICGTCGDPIQVTVFVENSLVDPKFYFNITIVEEPQRELIHFLEDAAKLDPRFQYVASYHSQWGYSVSSINGLASSDSDRQYWGISDYMTGLTLVEGLSSHVPSHQEMVLFNFTIYDH